MTVAQDLSQHCRRAEHAAVDDVLHHPRISRDARKNSAADFRRQRAPDVEHFLLLLVEKDRAGLFPTIGAQFEHLLDEYRGETDAEAISRCALSHTAARRVGETVASRNRLKSALEDAR